MRKVALALVALALMACGFGAGVDPGPDETVDLTSAMVVGTWRNAERDTTFMFAADNTFQALNVPREFFPSFADAIAPGFDPARDRIDTHGTWAVPGRSPSPLDRRRNLLTIGYEPGGFVPASGVSGFEAWWQGSQLILLTGRIGFLKCAEPCGIGSGLPSTSPR
ncbi:hypothetical protein [Dactylosporangium sp. NPDC006015]|uniref:hypothetical protein n=1 Tax=Dactylosporangium sp. NPDC006015 TaxID=3154576 RepID=UPI0033A50BD2